MKNKLLVVVAGPTASGKSELSQFLAKKFKTQILNADSRQIFKEMNIGTAKPSENELKETKHHLIGSVSISESYTAARYEQEALEILKNIFKKSDIAVLVGGSGMYIKALIDGLDEIPFVSTNSKQKAIEIFTKDGLKGLQDELKNKDSEYFKTVDLQNPRRLLRALEVIIETGKPFSSFLTETKKERPFKTFKLAIEFPRDVLYTRIEERVEKMMREGLLDEVVSLAPLRPNTALNTVGYSELFEFVDGNLDLETAVKKVKQNTRRYAKRQLTWFRKDQEYHWYPPDSEELIYSDIVKILADA